MKKIYVYLIFLFLGNYCYAQVFNNVASSNNINESFGEINVFGGGISFSDFDGDGDDDLTFGSKAGEPLHLYQNNGGSFQKIPSPVGHTDISKQIIWVDYDNDSDKDLFVCSYDAPNRLYRNDGGFTFTDVTASSGLPLTSGVTYGACFGDYDKDGWLDLYIINYTTTNQLFRNTNSGAIFTDVSNTTQTGSNNDPDFVALFFDMNNNGNPDLYVATDRYQFPNKMFKNNGSGVFSDVSSPSGTNVSIDAMNAGGGDYDNDGDYDLYVTNTTGPAGNDGSALLRNNGNETFTDVAFTSGTIFNRIGWGAHFFDYDNDLDLDLYVSSMHLDPTQPNALYVNDGVGNFTEPLPNGFPGDTIPSIANVVGDFNLDGKMDIAVSHEGNHTFHLWENQTSNSNNYLYVNLVGTTSNRSGIGSWVEIHINGNKYVRYTHCGESYLSQRSDNIHFGLGTHTMVDSVIVRWLSGNVDYMYNISANQLLSITENTTSPLPLELVDFSGSYQTDESIQLKWVTNSEIDFHGFEIEKSEDGLRYEKIGFTQGTNSNNIATYSFNDEQIQKGRLHYYRLKMIDNDGSFEYSKVISILVPNEVAFSFLKVFPNPVKEKFTTTYFSLRNQSTTVKIINQNGQVLLEKPMNLQSGTHQFELSVEQLSAGNYFLLMDGSFKVQQIPFTKH